MTTKEEARRILNDTPPEQCFWVNNGPILKNLEGLASAMLKISDDAFTHHVNSQKNDFSNWINDVIGDKKLANELLSSKSKESCLKKNR